MSEFPSAECQEVEDDADEVLSISSEDSEHLADMIHISSEDSDPEVGLHGRL